MSIKSLVFSVYAILFASMLQAQEIGMHSIENPNAVHGVYSIGNQPVLLETPYVPSTATTHFRVTFLEDATRFLDESIPNGYRFHKFEIGQRVGFLIFQSSDSIKVITIGVDVPSVSIVFKSPSVEEYRKVDFSMVSNEKLVLVASVLWPKIETDRRSRSGVEIYEINTDGTVQIRDKHIRERIDKTIIRRGFDFENGYALLREDKPGDLLQHRLTLLAYLEGDAEQLTVNLRDTFIYYPTCVAASDSVLFIAGSTLTSPLDMSSVSRGVFLKQVSFARPKARVSRVNPTAKVDSLNEYNRLKYIIKTVSTNNFITNGHVDTRPMLLEVFDTTVNILVGTYSLGDGITIAELLLGENDPTEQVLSLYDYSILRFDEEGRWLDSISIAREKTNILIPGSYFLTNEIRDRSLLRLRETFARDGLFRSVSMSDSQVYFVHHTGEMAHLACYDLVADTFFISDSVHFNLPAIELRDSHEIAFMQKHKWLDRIDRFDRGIDSFYVKHEPAGRKLAKFVSDVDYTYSMRDSWKEAFILASPRKAIRFRYDEIKNLLFYKSISLE